MEPKRISLLNNILRWFAPDLQRGLSPVLLQTLSETAAWCSQRERLGSSFRSPELDPSAILDIPSYSHDPGSIEGWIEKKRDSYRRAISWINRTRSELLKTAGAVAP